MGEKGRRRFTVSLFYFLQKGTLIAQFLSSKEETMSTTGKAQANDTGDWQNNREMNPQSNSSVAEDGLLEDDNTRSAGGDWRGEDDNEATGDPGRTPGKAEGVTDPERRGNE